MARTFPDLKKNQGEIRMGFLPELGDEKCDRNMYSGLRTDQTETITLHLKMVVMGTGVSMQRHERQLVLTPMEQKGWLAGQTRLFPAPIETACKNVHVKMTTMHCTYGSNEERRACPGSIRWNRLQGFKMIEVPDVK